VTEFGQQTLRKTLKFCAKFELIRGESKYFLDWSRNDTTLVSTTFYRYK